MKKVFFVGAAFAALSAVPAMAEAPNGDFVFKDNQGYDQACLVGAYSARIIQNGQFVGSGDNNYNIDQTNSPGSRAAAIQDLLESCRANGKNK